MAVPSNPKLSDVYAEFGAPAGTGLSQFLRGGPYVPNVAANAGVPTSLPIRLSQLAGAVKYVPISLGGSTFASGSTCGLPTTQTTFSSVASITVSGGNPSPSISWAYISGDNTMSLTNPGSALNAQWSSAVNRGASKSATYRITVSDGISSATRDVAVTLSHDFEC